MSLISEIRSAMNPARYLETLGFHLYEWQGYVLELAMRFTRILLRCSRQSGKSTIVAGLAAWILKKKPGGKVEIFAPTQKQARETSYKIREFLDRDLELKYERKSDEEMVLNNGSRCMVLVASEKASRGYSDPDAIILDEAAWIPDGVYKSIRPQLTGNEKCILIALSTPNGKMGFFYDAWENSRHFQKVHVTIPYKLYDDPTTGIMVVPNEIPEEAFRDHEASVGVKGYYSPRHTVQFLEEELDEIGSHYWRQEYGTEFLDTQGSVFSLADIDAAFSDRVTPMQVRGELGLDYMLQDDEEAWTIADTIRGG